MLTENDKNDKALAEKYFLNLVINDKNCKNPKDAKNDAKRVCDLYLKNQFISAKTKKSISSYLSRIK